MAPKKKTAPMEQHTTIAGETLEYPRPPGELAAFLAHVRSAAEDPRVSEGELVELIYGSENPLLDHTIFKGRGAVTREVFANPIYHVMLDLLDAKRVQAGTLDPERAAQRYSMTVTEAAERLEMTTSAVRQAIGAHRLAAWKSPSGPYLLDPHSVDTYRDRVKRRGPKAAPALRITMGNRPGASFRVKAAEIEEVSKTKLEDGGQVIEAVVPRFERVGIAFSGTRSNTFLVLEPDDEERTRDFQSYGVTGRFRIVEKVTDPEEASKRFRSFRPM